MKFKTKNIAIQLLFLILLAQQIYALDGLTLNQYNSVSIQPDDQSVQRSITITNDQLKKQDFNLVFSGQNLPALSYFQVLIDNKALELEQINNDYPQMQKFLSLSKADLKAKQQEDQDLEIVLDFQNDQKEINLQLLIETQSEEFSSPVDLNIQEGQATIHNNHHYDIVERQMFDFQLTLKKNQKIVADLQKFDLSELHTLFSLTLSFTPSQIASESNLGAQTVQVTEPIECLEDSCTAYLTVAIALYKPYSENQEIPKNLAFYFSVYDLNQISQDIFNTPQEGQFSLENNYIQDLVYITGVTEKELNLKIEESNSKLANKHSYIMMYKLNNKGKFVKNMHDSPVLPVKQPNIDLVYPAESYLIFYHSPTQAPQVSDLKYKFTVSQSSENQITKQSQYTTKTFTKENNIQYVYYTIQDSDAVALQISYKVGNSQNILGNFEFYDDIVIAKFANSLPVVRDVGLKSADLDKQEDGTLQNKFFDADQIQQNNVYMLSIKVDPELIKDDENNLQIEIVELMGEPEPAPTEELPINQFFSALVAAGKTSQTYEAIIDLDQETNVLVAIQEIADIQAVEISVDDQNVGQYARPQYAEYQVITYLTYDKLKSYDSNNDNVIILQVTFHKIEEDKDIDIDVHAFVQQEVKGQKTIINIDMSHGTYHALNQPYVLKEKTEIYYKLKLANGQQLITDLFKYRYNTLKDKSSKLKLSVSTEDFAEPDYVANEFIQDVGLQSCQDNQDSCFVYVSVSVEVPTLNQDLTKSLSYYLRFQDFSALENSVDRPQDKFTSPILNEVSDVFKIELLSDDTQDLPDELDIGIQQVPREIDSKFIIHFKNDQITPQKYQYLTEVPTLESLFTIIRPSASYLVFYHSRSDEEIQYLSVVSTQPSRALDNQEVRAINFDTTDIIQNVYYQVQEDSNKGLRVTFSIDSEEKDAGIKELFENFKYQMQTETDHENIFFPLGVPVHKAADLDKVDDFNKKKEFATDIFKKGDYYLIQIYAPLEIQKKAKKLPVYINVQVEEIEDTNDFTIGEIKEITIPDQELSMEQVSTLTPEMAQHQLKISGKNLKDIDRVIMKIDGNLVAVYQGFDDREDFQEMGLVENLDGVLQDGKEKSLSLTFIKKSQDGALTLQFVAQLVDVEKSFLKSYDMSQLTELALKEEFSILNAVYHFQIKIAKGQQIIADLFKQNNRDFTRIGIDIDNKQFPTPKSLYEDNIQFLTSPAKCGAKEESCYIHVTVKILAEQEDNTKQNTFYLYLKDLSHVHNGLLIENQNEVTFEQDSNLRTAFYMLQVPQDADRLSLSFTESQQDTQSYYNVIYHSEMENKPIRLKDHESTEEEYDILNPVQKYYVFYHAIQEQDLKVTPLFTTSKNLYQQNDKPQKLHFTDNELTQLTYYTITQENIDSLQISFSVEDYTNAKQKQTIDNLKYSLVQDDDNEFQTNIVVQTLDFDFKEASTLEKVSDSEKKLTVTENTQQHKVFILAVQVPASDSFVNIKFTENKKVDPEPTPVDPTFELNEVNEISISKGDQTNEQQAVLKSQDFQDNNDLIITGQHLQNFEKVVVKIDNQLVGVYTKFQERSDNQLVVLLENSQIKAALGDKQQVKLSIVFFKKTQDQKFTFSFVAQQILNSVATITEVNLQKDSSAEINQLYFQQDFVFKYQLTIKKGRALVIDAFKYQNEEIIDDQTLIGIEVLGDKTGLQVDEQTVQHAKFIQCSDDITENFCSAEFHIVIKCKEDTDTKYKNSFYILIKDTNKLLNIAQTSLTSNTNPDIFLNDMSEVFQIEFKQGQIPDQFEFDLEETPRPDRSIFNIYYFDEELKQYVHLDENRVVYSTYSVINPVKKYLIFYQPRQDQAITYKASVKQYNDNDLKPQENRKIIFSQYDQFENVYYKMNLDQIEGIKVTFSIDQNSNALQKQLLDNILYQEEFESPVNNIIFPNSIPVQSTGDQQKPNDYTRVLELDTKIFNKGDLLLLRLFVDLQFIANKYGDSFFYIQVEEIEHVEPTPIPGFELDVVKAVSIPNGEISIIESTMLQKLDFEHQDLIISGQNIQILEKIIVKIDNDLVGIYQNFQDRSDNQLIVILQNDQIKPQFDDKDQIELTVTFVKQKDDYEHLLNFVAQKSASFLVKTELDLKGDANIALNQLYFQKDSVFQYNLHLKKDQVVVIDAVKYQNDELIEDATKIGFELIGDTSPEQHIYEQTVQNVQLLQCNDDDNECQIEFNINIKCKGDFDIEQQNSFYLTIQDINKVENIINTPTISETTPFFNQMTQVFQIDITQAEPEEIEMTITETPRPDRSIYHIYYYDNEQEKYVFLDHNQLVYATYNIINPVTNYLIFYQPRIDETVSLMTQAVIIYDNALKQDEKRKILFSKQDQFENVYYQIQDDNVGGIRVTFSIDDQSPALQQQLLDNILYQEEFESPISNIIFPSSLPVQSSGDLSKDIENQRVLEVDASVFKQGDYFLLRLFVDQEFIANKQGDSFFYVQIEEVAPVEPEPEGDYKFNTFTKVTVQDGQQQLVQTAKLHKRFQDNNLLISAQNIQHLQNVQIKINDDILQENVEAQLTTDHQLIAYIKASQIQPYFQDNNYIDVTLVLIKASQDLDVDIDFIVQTENIDTVTTLLLEQDHLNLGINQVYQYKNSQFDFLLPIRQGQQLVVDVLKFQQYEGFQELDTEIGMSVQLKDSFDEDKYKFDQITVKSVDLIECQGGQTTCMAQISVQIRIEDEQIQKSNSFYLKIVDINGLENSVSHTELQSTDPLNNKVSDIFYIDLLENTQIEPQQMLIQFEEDPDTPHSEYQLYVYDELLKQYTYLASNKYVQSDFKVINPTQKYLVFYQTRIDSQVRYSILVKAESDDSLQQDEYRKLYFQEFDLFENVYYQIKSDSTKGLKIKFTYDEGNDNQKEMFQNFYFQDQIESDGKNLHFPSDIPILLSQDLQEITPTIRVYEWKTDLFKKDDYYMLRVYVPKKHLKSQYEFFYVNIQEIGENDPSPDPVGLKVNQFDSVFLNAEEEQIEKSIDIDLTEQLDLEISAQFNGDINQILVKIGTAVKIIEDSDENRSDKKLLTYLDYETLKAESNDDNKVKITITFQRTETEDFLEAFYLIRTIKAYKTPIPIDMRYRFFEGLNQLYEKKSDTFYYKLHITNQQKVALDLVKYRNQDIIDENTHISLTVNKRDFDTDSNNFHQQSVQNVDLLSCDEDDNQCTLFIVVKIRISQDDEMLGEYHSLYLSFVNYNEILNTDDNPLLLYTNSEFNRMSAFFAVDLTDHIKSVKDININIEEGIVQSQNSVALYYYFDEDEQQMKLLEQNNFLFASFPVLEPSQKFLVIYQSRIDKDIQIRASTQSSETSNTMLNKQAKDLTFDENHLVQYVYFNVPSSNNKGLSVKLSIPEDANDELKQVFDQFLFEDMFEQRQPNIYFPSQSPQLLPSSSLNKDSDFVKSQTSDQPIPEGQVYLLRVYVPRDAMPQQKPKSYTIQVQMEIISDGSVEPVDYQEIELNKFLDLEITFGNTLGLQSVIDPSTDLHITGRNLQSLENLVVIVDNNKLDDITPLQLVDQEITAQTYAIISSDKQKAVCTKDSCQIQLQLSTNQESADIELNLITIKRNTYGPMHLGKNELLPPAFSVSNINSKQTQDKTFHFSFISDVGEQTLIAVNKYEATNVKFYLTVSQESSTNTNFPPGTNVEGFSESNAEKLDIPICTPLNGDDYCYFYITLQVNFPTQLEANKFEQNSFFLNFFSLEEAQDLHTMNPVEFTPSVSENRVIQVFTDYQISGNDELFEFQVEGQGDNLGQYSMSAQYQGQQYVEPRKVFDFDGQYASTAVSYTSTKYYIVFYPLNFQSTYTFTSVTDNIHQIAQANENYPISVESKQSYAIFKADKHYPYIQIQFSDLQNQDSLSVYMNVYHTSDEQEQRLFNDLENGEQILENDFEIKEVDEGTYIQLTFTNSHSDNAPISFNLKFESDEEQPGEGFQLDNIIHTVLTEDKPTKSIQFTVDPTKELRLIGSQFSHIKIQLAVEFYEHDLELNDYSHTSKTIYSLPQERIAEICGNLPKCQGTIDISSTEAIEQQLEFYLQITQPSKKGMSYYYNFKNNLQQMNQVQNFYVHEYEETTISQEILIQPGQALVAAAGLESVVSKPGKETKTQIIVTQALQDGSQFTIHSDRQEISNLILLPECDQAQALTVKDQSFCKYTVEVSVSFMDQLYETSVFVSVSQVSDIQAISESSEVVPSLFNNEALYIYKKSDSAKQDFTLQLSTTEGNLQYSVYQPRILEHDNQSQLEIVDQFAQGDFIALEHQQGDFYVVAVLDIQKPLNFNINMDTSTIAELSQEKTEISIQQRFASYTVQDDSTDEIKLTLSNQGTNNVLQKIEVQYVTYVATEEHNQIYPTNQDNVFDSNFFEINGNEAIFPVSGFIEKDLKVLFQFKIKGDHHEDKFDVTVEELDTSQFDGEEKDVEFIYGTFTAVHFDSLTEKLNFNIEVTPELRDVDFFVNIQLPYLYHHLTFKAIFEQSDSKTVEQSGDSTTITSRQTQTIFHITNQQVLSSCENADETCKLTIQFQLKGTYTLPTRSVAFIQYVTQKSTEGQNIPVFENMNLLTHKNALASISQNIMYQGNSHISKYNYKLKMDDLQLEDNEEIVIFATQHASRGKDLWTSVLVQPLETEPTDFNDWPSLDNTEQNIDNTENIYFQKAHVNYLAISVYVRYDPMQVDKGSILVGYLTPTTFTSYQVEQSVNDVVQLHKTVVDQDVTVPFEIAVKQEITDHAVVVEYTYQVYREQGAQPVLLNEISGDELTFQTLNADKDTYYTLIIPDEIEDTVFKVYETQHPDNMEELFQDNQHQITLDFTEENNFFTLYKDYTSASTENTQFYIRFGKSDIIRDQNIEVYEGVITKTSENIEGLDKNQYTQLMTEDDGTKFISHNVMEQAQCNSTSGCYYILRIQYTGEFLRNHNYDMALQLLNQSPDDYSLDFGKSRNIPLSQYFPQYSVTSKITLSKLKDTIILSSQVQVPTSIEYTLKVKETQLESIIQDGDNHKSASLYSVSKEQLQQLCGGETETECIITLTARAVHPSDLISSNTASVLQLLTMDVQGNVDVYEDMEMPSFPVNQYYSISDPELETSYREFHYKLSYKKGETRLVSFVPGDINKERLVQDIAVKQSTENYLPVSTTEEIQAYMSSGKTQKSVIAQGCQEDTGCVIYVTVYNQVIKVPTVPTNNRILPDEPAQPVDANFYIQNSLLESKQTDILDLAQSQQIDLASDPNQNLVSTQLRVKLDDAHKNGFELKFRERCVDPEQTYRNGYFQIFQIKENNQLEQLSEHKIETRNENNHIALANPFSEYLFLWISEPDTTKIADFRFISSSILQAQPETPLRTVFKKSSHYKYILYNVQGADTNKISILATLPENYHNGLSLNHRNIEKTDENQQFPEGNNENTKEFSAGQEIDFHVKPSKTVLMKVFQREATTEDQSIEFTIKEIKSTIPPPPPSGGNNLGLIIGLSCGGVVLIAIVAYFIIRHKRKQAQSHLDYQDIEYDEENNEFSHFQATSTN